MMDDSLEHALVQLKADRRDEGAWRSLYFSLWPEIVRRLRLGRFESASHVQDLGQEVFKNLILYCRFDRFESSDDLRRYVGVVCTNAARDAWRKRRSEEDVRVGVATRSRGRVVEAQQQRNLEAAELRERILATLSTSEKHLFALVARGYELKELARRLGVSYSAAGVRLFRLRTRIQKGLQGTQT
jgi:RNA polymerase sigma factor (sigma-70 family)